MAGSGGTDLARIPAPVWAALAAAAAMSVWALNGRPLFYVDTAAYLESGHGVLRALGLVSGGGAVGAGGGTGAPAGVDAVSGNRSALYSAVLAGFSALGWLGGVVIVNLAALWGAFHLFAVGAIRSVRGEEGALAASAIAVLAGCLSTLPFEVALLMPDILAPVLVVALAALIAFGPAYGWGERAALAMLALVSVLAHPSHLVMAALILPAALVLAPIRARNRAMLLGALALLVLGVGLAEKTLFGLAVDRLQGRAVFYQPFLTARLIADGPGRSYLAEHCPDPGLATCALGEALATGTDPARYEAQNILFSEKPGQASFKSLPDPLRRAISQEEAGFVRAVVLDRPLAVAGAFLANTGSQLIRNGVGMTVPDGFHARQTIAMSDRFPEDLAAGRLVTAPRGWIAGLDTAQAIVAAASALLLAGIAFGAGPAAPLPLRAAVFAVLWGILANAAVCGGISVPADRYGARVIFLLPAVAGLCLSVLALKRGRRWPI